MPTVGKVKFGYTKDEIKKAKEYAEKTGKKVKTKKTKKKKTTKTKKRYA